VFYLFIIKFDFFLDVKSLTVYSFLNLILILYKKSYNYINTRDSHLDRIPVMRIENDPLLIQMAVVLA
jgi:hypothetical protein